MAIKKVIPAVEFDLPNLMEWQLVADSPPEPGNKGIVMFKHKPLYDSIRKCQVEPIMAILYESHSDTLDVVEYSVNLLGKKKFQMKWDLLGGCPEQSKDCHSAVFDAKYTRETVEHSVILGYVKCNNFGVEIICDSTTDFFPALEDEMRKFLRSFRIVDKK